MTAAEDSIKLFKGRRIKDGDAICLMAPGHKSKPAWLSQLDVIPGGRVYPINLKEAEALTIMNGDDRP